MALSDLTARAVIQAAGEFEDLGRDAFLAKYGFGRARTTYLVHNGQWYDAVGLAGAAHGHATGEPMRAEEADLDEETVAEAFRDLGLDVHVVAAPRRDATGDRVVRVDEGLKAWSLAAFDLLSELAEQGGAPITEAELAARVQAATGLRTDAAQRTWLGRVLSVVSARCAQLGVPSLTRLVVGSGGNEGTGLARANGTTGASRPSRTRAVATAPKRAAPAEVRRGAVCPRCFMEMPVAGACPNCD